MGITGGPPVLRKSSMTARPQLPTSSVPAGRTHRPADPANHLNRCRILPAGTRLTAIPASRDSLATSLVPREMALTTSPTYPTVITNSAHPERTGSDKQRAGLALLPSAP